MYQRRIISLTLTFALIGSTMAMIWKGCVVLTNCTHPLIIVLSDDAPWSWYNLGDILVLTNYQTESLRAGDNVAFEIKDRDIPIIHRIIRVHEKNDGNSYFLTKGDNNNLDDRGLYPIGQQWLERKDIIGKVKGYIPYLGIVIIVMTNIFQLNLSISIVIIFFMLTYHRWRSMIIF